MAVQGQITLGHVNAFRLDPEGCEDPVSWSQKKLRTKRS